MVTDKYLVADAVNKIEVACQPVNGHVLHICNGKQGLYISTEIHKQDFLISKAPPKGSKHHTKAFEG